MLLPEAFELLLPELPELTADLDCLEELPELTDLEVDLVVGALVDDRCTFGLVVLDDDDLIVLLLLLVLTFGDE